MEWICGLVGAAGANIFSVASVNGLMIWGWLLIAVQVAVCALLRGEVRSPTDAVPVLSKPAPPTRRAAPDASRR
jgi:hypothetical protein